MAEINLLDIQPHQVSRDMRGYSVFVYGEPKSGKTTIATKFPKHLLLAMEKGYAAIPGAMAQPINSWAEFKKVLRQLKDQAVKAKFETIIVDTVDIAFDLCEKYICANAKRSDSGYGVDSIQQIPYGGGYKARDDEFDSALRQIVQMGYGLVMISHATDKAFVDENKHEFNKIVPTLDKRAKNIVSRLVDLYGYSRIVVDDKGVESTKLFLRGTTRFEAGSRFKYTPAYIDFTYDDLVQAICDAIDKQSEEDGAKYFTDEAQNLHIDTPAELDFDELMAEFESITKGVIDAHTDEEVQTTYGPMIVRIVEKYIGKGNKVGNMSKEQTEALSLIVDDLKEAFK